MKKIGICGHFGFNKNFFDGQTIKTQMVYNELLKHCDGIEIVDTHDWRKNIFQLLKHVIKEMKTCSDIIIMPAQNGLRVFCPLFVLCSVFFDYRTHYIVVGGWLGEFIEKRRWLKYLLCRINYIYVETESMKKKLIEISGLRAVYVIPNFKDLKVLSEHEIYIRQRSHQYKFCTFSRVIKEKGIEDAIEAIKRVNLKLKDRVHCTLDIYGPIDDTYRNEILNIITKNRNIVRYCGSVKANKSVETLKNYDALLFPTFYEGEGFAGTLIDSFCAALPVIASDWKYNAELVDSGKTGLIFKTHDLDDFEKKLIEFINFDNKVSIKLSCLKKAKEYLPNNALDVLFNNLKWKV